MIYNDPKEITWKHLLFIAIIVIGFISILKYLESEQEMKQINEHVAEISEK